MGIGDFTQLKSTGRSGSCGRLKSLQTDGRQRTEDIRLEDSLLSSISLLKVCH